MKGNSLHKLVHGLSKSEKRYLKRLMVFGAGNRDSNARDLFDQLLKMERYDEAALEKSLVGKKVGKQVAVYQTLLFELVMRGLRMMRGGEDMDWKIRKELTEIEILFERELFGECRRKLNRMVALCKQFEKRTFLLELHRWEYKLMLVQGQAGIGKEIGEKQIERKEVSRALFRQTRVEIAEAYSRVLLRKDDYRGNPAYAAEILDLMKRWDLYPPDIETEFYTWCEWRRAKANLAYVNRDVEGAKLHYGAVLEALEARPRWLRLQSAVYLSVLNNYLNCCFFLKHTDAYLTKLKELRSVAQKLKASRLEFETTAFSQDILYNIHFRSFEATEKVIGEFELWLDKHGAALPVSKALTNFYNVTAVFFANGGFNDANRWLSRILNAPGKGQRDDLRNFARVLQMVIHYELDNLGLVEYLLASAEKSFRRKGLRDSYLMFFIPFFRKLILATVPAEKTALMQQLQTDIINYVKASNQPAPAGVGEINIWIQSRLEGIPIREFFEKQIAPYRS